MPTQTGQLVKKLYSSKKEVRTKAKRSILKAARASKADRAEVVKELIAALHKTANDPDQSTGWYEAADVIGTLKAVEATEVLVQHLDYNDGVTGFSLAHFPAVRAVIKIGPPTIPYLVNALKSLKASVRKSAARALGDIGGTEAKESLRKALDAEQDPEAKYYIQSALNQLSPIN